MRPAFLFGMLILPLLAGPPTLFAQASFPPPCESLTTRDGLEILVWNDAPLDHAVFRTVHEAVKWAEHCKLTNPTFKIANGPYPGEKAMTLPPGSILIGGKAVHQAGPCPGDGGGGGGGGPGTGGGGGPIGGLCETFTFTPGPKCAVHISGSNSGPIFTTTGDAKFSFFTLERNTISGNGAGINAPGGAVTVTECCFEGLVAASGGAIWASGQRLSIDGCRFSANEASGWPGGAIFKTAGAIDLAGCRFVGNRAMQGKGGAVFGDDTDLEVDFCSFDGNHARDGGALGVTFCRAILANCPVIVGNKAIGGSGGAVWAENSACGMTQCTVTGNEADGAGGAARFTGSETIAVAQQCKFLGRNRSWLSGGGLSIDAGARVGLQECEFRAGVAPNAGAIIVAQLGVLAMSGGGISGHAISLSGAGILGDRARVHLRGVEFDHNIAGARGGAVFIRAKSVLILDDCGFIGNEASLGGGGVRVQSGSTLTATLCNFEQNRAWKSTGGAISADGAGSPIRIRDAQFFDNVATSGTHPTLPSGKGGAVSVERCLSALLSGLIAFDGNKAGSDGGALFAEKSAVTLTDGLASFTSNEAISGDGGALCATKGAVVMLLTGTAMSHNRAPQGKGGGIAILKSSVVFCLGTGGLDHNIAFLENEAAEQGGGVVVAERGRAFFWGTVNFDSNRSGLGGAGIVVLGKGEIFIDGGDAHATAFRDHDSTSPGSAIRLDALGGEVFFNIRGVVFDQNGNYQCAFVRGSQKTSGSLHTCEFSSVAGGLLLTGGGLRAPTVLNDIQAIGGQDAIVALLGPFDLANSTIGDLSSRGILMQETVAHVVLSRLNTSSPIQMRVLGGTVVVERTDFVGLGSAVGVSVEGGAAVTISHSALAGHGSFAVARMGLAGPPVAAGDNWWGRAGGPLHPSNTNPLPKGDVVTNRVLFTPPLPQPPDPVGPQDLGD